MIRAILEVPNKLLKKKSEPVEEITSELSALISDMFETMYDAPGIGLAAPQIGVLKRLIVLDTAPKDEPRKPLVLINPEIIGVSEQKILHNEGCLSIPGEYADVERFEAVTVRYIDEKGTEKTLDAEGLMAIAIQHETDHLDGKLFIEHLSKTKRDMLLRRLAKNRRLEKADKKGEKQP